MNQIQCSELQVLEPSRAEIIRKTFEPMVIMVGQFEERFNEIVSQPVTPSLCAKAKRLRLDIATIRHATEKLRKSEKEEYLRAGKAIDGVANVLKWAVEEKEGRLRAIETHYEEIERQRIEALQVERVEAIAPYLDGAAERDFRKMEPDVWEAYFAARKREHDDRLAAEAKAEAERIAREKAEAEERERIRQENARLKAEAEKREKAHREELTRLKVIEDARRKEAQAIAEAKAQAEAELAAIRVAEEQVREAEKLKGDAEKWTDLVIRIHNLTTSPGWESDHSKTTFAQVAELLGKVNSFIDKKIFSK